MLWNSRESNESNSSINSLSRSLRGSFISTLRCPHFEQYSPLSSLPQFSQNCFSSVMAKDTVSFLLFQRKVVAKKNHSMVCCIRMASTGHRQIHNSSCLFRIPNESTVDELNAMVFVLRCRPVVPTLLRLRSSLHAQTRPQLLRKTIFALLLFREEKLPIVSPRQG